MIWPGLFQTTTLKINLAFDFQSPHSSTVRALGCRIGWIFRYIHGK